MRAQTIAQLAWYQPISDETLEQADTLPQSGIATERVTQIIHYAECHKNLQFGWEFALQVTKDPDFIFPAILHGDDLYVWRAFKYLQGYSDPIIDSALSLTLPKNKTLKNQINALLVTKDVTPQFIADKLSINLDTIIAYEKLFFNVLDRKKDHSYIASIVYPEGRLVEAAEDYIENTGISDILLRAGFTRGANHVLYAGGYKDNPFSSDDLMQTAEKLDKIFLADGCLYATMGWANQRNNARPIINAKASIIAGKMGKGENTGTGQKCITPGEIMRTELATISKLKMEAHTKRLANNIIPEIPQNLNP